MAAPRTIGVLVGSLRRGSYTRMVAKAAAALAPAGFTCSFVEIGDLPFYNQDLEDGGAPEAWSSFRRKINALESILFATPEYNRSVPAVLKNAIDVGSRPRQQNAWQGKPAAIISVSPGNLSGFGANHHLRQSLAFIDMPTLQQPEAYVGGAARLFDEAGNLTNDEMRKFLKGFLDAFAAWIGKVAAQPAAPA